MSTDKVDVTREAMLSLINEFLSNKEELQRLSVEVVEMLISKNHDYGDAWQRYGIFTPLIRMNDKLLRVKTLSGGERAMVADEKIVDTLKDIFGYSWLALLRLQWEDRYSKVCADPNNVPSTIPSAPLTGFERAIQKLLDNDNAKGDGSDELEALKDALRWRDWFMRSSIQDVCDRTNEPCDGLALANHICQLYPQTQGDGAEVIFNFLYGTAGSILSQLMRYNEHHNRQ